MAITNEQLVANLDVNIRKLEKSMDRADRKTDRTFTKIEHRGKTLEKRLNAINPNFARFLAPAVIIGGVTALIGQVGNVAQGIADIGREARRAGLDVKDFQELKYVSKQNRIDIDQMVDGLKELALRADEFLTTGKESASEAFTRLGLSGDDLKTRLEKPNELLVEIIDRLGKFDKAAQIRISDELFGGSAGERFVELIDKGADGIRDTIKEAHDLGVIMDRDLIAKADELDKKFSKISTTVGTALKVGIVEAASALEGFIDKFQDFQNQSKRSLQSNLADAFEERADIAEQIKEVAKEIEEDRNGVIPLISQNLVATGEAELARLKEIELEVIARIKRISAAIVGDRVDNSKGGKGKKNTFKPGGGGNGTTSKRDRVRELITELERELSIVHLSEETQRASDAARRAGAKATDEQREKIIALSEALYQETTAIETQEKALREANAERNRAFEESKNNVKYFMDDFRAGLREGESGWESFQEAGLNALDQIAQKLSDMAIDNLFDSAFGGGSGGNFLSALLGGGVSSPLANAGFASGKAGLFASGGYTGNGGVNEAAGIVHGQEFVVNAAATKENRGLLESMNAGKLVSPKAIASPMINADKSGNEQRTRVEVVLSPDLQARILDEAAGQAIQISRDSITTYDKHGAPERVLKTMQRFHGGGNDL